MEVIDWIADKIGDPICEAIDKTCPDPDLAYELKSKLGSVASLSLWKFYRLYLLEETSLNRNLAENFDTIKLNYN
tara:strand:+ start:3494 stop:3718 length:225 start_codon:yes stop_codon:yes gene_type:complete